MASQWMEDIPTCSNSEHITHFYTPSTEGTPLPMATDHILIMKCWGIKSSDKFPLARKSGLRSSLLKWAIKIRKVETKLLTAPHQFPVIPKEKWPVHFSPKHQLPWFFFFYVIFFPLLFFPLLTFTLVSSQGQQCQEECCLQDCKESHRVSPPEKDKLQRREL